MAVETVWIPAALVPGSRPTDLDGSLYELLARRYRIVTGAATVTIEPVLPDEATRGHLAHRRGPGMPAPADARFGRPRPRDHVRELRLPR